MIDMAKNTDNNSLGGHWSEEFIQGFQETQDNWRKIPIALKMAVRGF